MIKKRIEDNTIKLGYLADFNPCQVLICIIKKSYKEKLRGHKCNLVNPHKVYVNQIR